MIKHLSFKDLPTKRRAQHGEAMIREMRRALFMPGLTDDQRKAIQARIAKVEAVIRGKAPPPTPKPVAKHHVVVVEEGLQVQDRMK